MKSRRTFLKIATLGAAALALPATARAKSTVRRSRRGATTAPPAAVEAELRKQKQATEETLRTIRAFPLPAGSEMACAFVLVRPRQGRSKPGDQRAGGGGR